MGEFGASNRIGHPAGLGGHHVGVTDGGARVARKLPVVVARDPRFDLRLAPLGEGEGERRRGN